MPEHVYLDDVLIEYLKRDDRLDTAWIHRRHCRPDAPGMQVERYNIGICLQQFGYERVTRIGARQSRFRRCQ